MEILALEASTTSAKAMMYHTDSHRFDTLAREFAGQGDKAKRGAEDMFLQTMALGREAAAGKKVDMIALSGTWHSLLACGADMAPASPVYLWDFMGAGDICRSLRRDEDYTRSFYHRTGCMVNAIYPAFKIRWLLGERPELRDALFLSLGTYFTYRMTGRWVSTRCLSSGSGLLSVGTGDYDAEVLRELGLKREQLSELVEWDSAFPLSREAAELLGLTPGIPVLPANSDGGLNQVGVGALREGVATLSVGTSGAIRLTTAAPVLPDKPGTWCYRSPKAWLSGAATNGCCNCVDWARTALFPAGVSYGDMESGGGDPRKTPTFLPFLFGERCPGWDDRRTGGFMNCLPEHNAHDLYRAVQEGVIFNLYQCYLLLASEVGAPREIRLSGGILNSPRWTQMCADIFGCAMTVDTVVHGSLLGACVLAMEALGVIGDARSYSPQPGAVVAPNAGNAGLYNEKYRKYLECYNK